MLKRDDLIAFINETIGDELLQKSLEKDEMLNGIQFLGAGKVEKVALGVSLNEEFLLNAAEMGANFCIFHHGFDTRTYKSRYPVYSQKRLKIIFNSNMTIAGYHYALDAHPAIGNNAQIIKKIGAKISQPLYDEWGYTATFDKPQDLHDLAHKCQEIFDHDIFVVGNGPRQIKIIGVVSGGAKPYESEVAEMQSKGVELFISGETSESSPHKMQEAGINYFVCGHYSTEKFGVQELGRKIKSHYKDKIVVEFIDIKNPV